MASEKLTTTRELKPYLPLLRGGSSTLLFENVSKGGERASWDHSRLQSCARSLLAAHPNVMHSISSLIEPGADRDRSPWCAEKRALANHAWSLRQKSIPRKGTFSSLRGSVSRRTALSLMRLCWTSSGRILRIMPRPPSQTPCTHSSPCSLACCPTWHCSSPTWRPSPCRHLLVQKRRSDGSSLP